MIQGLDANRAVDGQNKNKKKQPTTTNRPPPKKHDTDSQPQNSKYRAREGARHTERERDGDREKEMQHSHDADDTGATVAAPAATGDGVVRLPPRLAFAGAPVQDAAGLGSAVITCDKTEENNNEGRTWTKDVRLRRRSDTAVLLLYMLFSLVSYFSTVSLAVTTLFPRGEHGAREST